MKVFIQVVLIFLILITSFQTVKKDEWYIRISDFPHVQLTVISILFLIAAFVLSDLKNMFDGVVLLSGVALVGYQGKIIWPYTRLADKQAKDWKGDDDEQSISIIESNVLMDNEDYEKLVNQVKQYQPDMVIALETDEKWEEGLRGIEKDFRVSIKIPLDNTYGILLYSKLELKNNKIEYLIEEDVPSIETDVILKNGKEIRLYVVHPEPPSPTENERSTERDAELIIVGKRAKKCELPVIVAGDLNDVAWSHTTRLFQRLSGLLDPRIGRGFFNTFHVDYPLLRWPLDHIFHSKHFLVKRIFRLESMGSDHFPMLIELVLDPALGKAKNGEPEEFDEEDQEEAVEKLNDIRESNNDNENKE